jgi:ELWxxDGT repeat protein
VSLQQLYRTGTTGTVNALRVTAPWSEPDVTWNKLRNSFDPVPVAGFTTVNGTSIAQTIDILGLAQGWVSGSVPNHGLLFVESPLQATTDFRSSESPYPSQRPKLDLCYVTCTDGVQNGDESAVDCGGSCAPCAAGQACNADGDCLSGWCLGVHCGPTATTVPTYTSAATYPTPPQPNPDVTVLPASIGSQCFRIPGGLRCANNPGVQSWFRGLRRGSIIVSSSSGDSGDDDSGGGGFSFGIDGDFGFPDVSIPSFDIPGFQIPWPNLFLHLDFDWRKHINFIDLNVDGRELFSTSHGSVGIDRGRINLSGDFDIYGTVDPAGMARLGVTFEPELAGEISVSGSFSDAESQSGLTTLWEDKTTWVQFAGPIPVVEVLTVGVDLGYEFCAGGAIDVNGGAAVTLGARGGFDWSRFDFRPIGEVSSPSFTAIGPSAGLEGATALKVFLRPRVSVSVYGLGGPGVALRPYTRFNAGFDGDRCPPASWEMAAGIGFDLFGDLGGFGMSCVPHEISEVTVADVVLASGTAGPCMPGLHGMPASCTPAPAEPSPPPCSSYPAWPPPADGGGGGPLCSDGILDGGETGIDCGGSCVPCGDGAWCIRAGDCISLVCTTNACAAPTCSDGIQNGGETGLDCGAPGCASCPEDPTNGGCSPTEQDGCCNTSAAPGADPDCARTVRLLKDINPGAAPSAPGYFAPIGDKIVFSAEDAATGRELWVSDGTSLGTAMVMDLAPGSTGTCFTEYGDELSWFSEEQCEQFGLTWRTTTASSNPIGFKPLGDRLVFLAQQQDGSSAVWSTDGTTAGTVLVRGGFRRADMLTAAGSQLFFRGDDGASGVELWKTDGTTSGTVLVRDINPGADGSEVTSLVAHGDTVYFYAYAPGGPGPSRWENAGLWKSDGTGPGTVFVRGDMLNISWTSFANSRVFFFGTDSTTGVHGLWACDEDGSNRLFLHDTGGSGGPLASFGGFIYVAGRLGLYRTDGHSAATLFKDFSAEGCTACGIQFANKDVPGKLFFVALGTSRPQYQLWVTDGVSRTERLGTWQEIAIEQADIDVPVEGGIAFIAYDPAHGRELWRTDGTPGGTELYEDFTPGDRYGCSNSYWTSEGVCLDQGYTWGDVPRSTGLFNVLFFGGSFYFRYQDPDQSYGLELYAY